MELLVARCRPSRRALLHTVIMMGILACGGKPDAASPKHAGQFRVALLTPGPISDQAWNAGAYAGLMRIKDSLGAQVSHVQTKTPAEFEENFRQYGTQGYDLVFGHGFEFQDAAERVSAEFPRTVFVTTSGGRTGPNLAGMDFAFEEGSYLAGMAAASVSKAGRIGAIGGADLPPVKASFAAFEAGARAVNPGVVVIVSYLGSWDDVSAGKEQALAQIGRGVDVIFQNADAAGLGVIQGARERQVLAIGANANQNGVAPGTMLGSVVIDLPHALLTVAREVRDGKFVPRVISLGSRDEVVSWTGSPALSRPVPAAVALRIDSVRARMRAGAFRLSSASAPHK
ncbi:MAG: BMP family protein [Gemmatimonadetes bacterium]|nr:BMP family protein [Gemmatimonadota bacterium]